MRADEKIMKRLDELIELGEQVLATKKSVSLGSDLVNAQMASQWATSVQNLLVRVFGQDSEHYKNFTKQVGPRRTRISAESSRRASASAHLVAHCDS